MQNTGIKHNTKMSFYLYTILIILTIYTDTPLQGKLEAYGQSLLPSLSIILYAIMFLRGKLTMNSNFIKSFCGLVLFTSFVSILSLLYFWITGEELTQKGEFLPVKFLKVLLYFLSYLCYLSVVINLGKNFCLKQLFRPFLWTFWTLTAILLVEYFQLPHALSFLHYHSGEYYRIRLLTPEASWTAGMIEVFSLMSIYYSLYIKKSRIILLSIIAATLLHITLSGSKTLLIAVLLVVLIIGCNSMKRASNVQVFSALFFSIFIGWLATRYILPGLIVSFTNDIEQATSTITRTYSIVCAYAIGTVFPFGTGFQSYVTIFPYVMNHYLYLIGDLGIYFNTDEIITYANGTSDAAMTAKSFLAQASMYWGVVGTGYFLKILYTQYHLTLAVMKRKETWTFRCLFFLFVIQILFSTDLGYEYLAFISLMILYRHRLFPRIEV